MPLAVSPRRACKPTGTEGQRGSLEKVNFVTPREALRNRYAPLSPRQVLRRDLDKASGLALRERVEVAHAPDVALQQRVPRGLARGQGATEAGPLRQTAVSTSSVSAPLALRDAEAGGARVVADDGGRPAQAAVGHNDRQERPAPAQLAPDRGPEGHTAPLGQRHELVDGVQEAQHAALEQEGADEVPEEPLHLVACHAPVLLQDEVQRPDQLPEALLGEAPGGRRLAEPEPEEVVKPRVADVIQLGDHPVLAQGTLHVDDGLKGVVRRVAKEGVVVYVHELGRRARHDRRRGDLVKDPRDARPNRTQLVHVRRLDEEDRPGPPHGDDARLKADHIPRRVSTEGRLQPARQQLELDTRDAEERPEVRRQPVLVEAAVDVARPTEQGPRQLGLQACQALARC